MMGASKIVNFIVRRAAALENGVAFCQGSLGTIRSGVTVTFFNTIRVPGTDRRSSTYMHIIEKLRKVFDSNPFI